MKRIQLILVIVFTLVISTVLIIFFDHQRLTAKAIPKELYQVYLGSEKIGIIQSKTGLEKYINDKQKEVKKKYHVSNVYPPNNLYIQKYIGYNNEIMSEKEVYDIIKEKNPFTIKGYVFTIKKDNSSIKVNVLNTKLMDNALKATIEAFVTSDQYNEYQEYLKTGKQVEIKGTGARIDNLGIPNITKKRAYIPIDEYIFTNQKELSKYLLFGTLKEQTKYFVEPGDTIESIAFNNKLGTNEFLIVNPQFTNANNLLFPGQKVNIGLINPLVNVTVSQYVVEDITVNYKTQTIYDKNLPAGKSYVKQTGVKGVQRVKEQVKLVNGDIVPSPRILGAETLKISIDKIVVIGTKSSGGTVIVNAGGWVWPTRVPYVITSSYGYRWGKFHEAVDISGTGYGSVIYAANKGTVYRTWYDSTGGNQIIIKHDVTCTAGGVTDYCSTVYAHMSKVLVKRGQKVSAGQIVGLMGATGFATGTHLHFGTFAGIALSGGARSFNPLSLYR